MGKLAEYLEKGRNPKGLKGFVNVGIDYNDKPLWIPVTIKGFSFGKRSCSIEITATSDGGMGELTITPCQLLDSLDDVIKRKERLDIQNKQKDDNNQLLRWSTVAGKRRNIIEYYENLPNWKKAIIEQELKDEGLENLTKLTSGNVRKYAELVTKVNYDLLGVEEIDD